MAQWAIVIVLIVIVGLLFESRLTFGSKIVRMERDLAWLIAGLRKWGLAAPEYEVDTRMASAVQHDQRPQEPPARPRR